MKENPLKIQIFFLKLLEITIWKKQKNVQVQIINHPQPVW